MELADPPPATLPPCPGAGTAVARARARGRASAPRAGSRGRPSPGRNRPRRSRRPASAPRAADRRRQVDARELEEADALAARVDVVARRRDEPFQQRRSEHRLVRGQRRRQREGVRVRVATEAGSSCRSRSSRSRRAPPRRSGATSALGSGARRTSRGERERVRDLVEVEARDLLDEVGLAGDVAAAPGRHRHVPVVGPIIDHVEAEAGEHAALVGRVDLDADQLVRPLGPEVNDRPLGELGVRPRPSPASARRRARRSASSRGRRPARRGRGRRPSPSGASPPCGAEPLRALEDRERLEVRGLEQDVVVDSSTSLSSPPMIPASATGSFASAITRSVASSGAPRRRACGSSRRRARADDDPALGELGHVERVQRVAERQHHVVGDVDDVRERAHPDLERRAFSHAGEGPRETFSNRRPM